MPAPFQEFLGLPMGLNNAPYELPDTFRMRVGVPHRSGKLAFHAFEREYPVMVSANAFWDREKREFKIPDATDLQMTDFALDSAGFVAMKAWGRSGEQKGIAGVYPWSLSSYLLFAAELGPSWYAAPDLCCEPEIASNKEEVNYRVRATATLLEACLRQIYAWHEELSKRCNARTIANMFPAPVPILQGWTVDDYQLSAELTQRVWERWQPWLGPPALIGVGSVCRRTVRHPKHGLLNILAGLEGHLHPKSRLHMFGVKGTVLSHLKQLPWVASADSMAYDVTARRKAFEGGYSNTVKHRAGAMSDWMESAASRMRPAVGDQHRLPFFAEA